MADTNTTNLNLIKPEIGGAEDTWGVSINSDLDALDAIFSATGTEIDVRFNSANFDDNKKAIFGTGNDLQIYHDGSNSYIQDTGTGGLFINGSQIVLASPTGEVMINTVPDNAVSLYYDNAAKLATTSTGVDVAGVIKFTGGYVLDSAHSLRLDSAASQPITFSVADSEKVRIDSSGRLGIGTSSPSVSLEVNGNVKFGTPNPMETSTNIVKGASGQNGFQLRTAVTSATAPTFSNVDDTNTGIFFPAADTLGFTTAGSERARIDSSGNLGIGTSSPASALHIKGDGKEIFLSSADYNVARIIPRGTGSNLDKGLLSLFDAGTEDVRFDTGGNSWINSGYNLGIGTTSPQGNLHVEGAAGASGGGIIYVTDADNGSTASDALHISKSGDTAFVYNRESSGDLQLGAGNTAGHVVIKSSGNVGIGISSPDSTLHIKTSVDNSVAQGLVIERSANTDKGYINYNGGAFQIRSTVGDPIAFGETDAEHMRIAPDGNIGIGTTSVGTKLHVVSGTDNNIATDVSEIRFIGADKPITGEQANLVIQTNDDMAADKGGSIGFGGRHTTSSTNGSNFAHISGRKENSTSANFAGYLSFGTADSASDIHERMRVDSSGNVGIGDTNPSAIRLSVVTPTANHVGLQVENTNTADSFGMIVKGGNDANDYTADFRKRDNTSIVRILGDGNVGISTTSPSQKLHVDGIIASQNSAQGTGLLQLQGYGNTAYINHTGSSNLHFRMGSGFTTRMTLTNAGNLGVGTSSPGSLLTVEGDIRQTSGDFLYGGGGNWDIKHLADDQNIVFYTSQSGSATEKMRIKANGAIGIGTSSPSASHKLTVGGDTKFTGQLSMSDNQLIKMGDSEDFAFYHDTSIGNVIKSNTSDMDIVIQGNDGGSTITALSFDMSQAGEADFNSAVKVAGGITSHQTNRGVLEYASNFFKIRSYGATAGSGAFVINVGGGGGSADSEALRIDSSGNLLVGTTSAVSTSNSQTGAEARANGIVVGAVSGNASFIANRLSSDGDAILLRRDGTTVGSISVTGSATAYNTSSDARLKDVTGTARGLDVINELNPVAYNWKADGKADEGLIAQEVKELVPNAVVGSEADMYSMDYSKLVVHLVAGMQEQQKQMQEQQAIIEDLQTQLNKLKR